MQKIILITIVIMMGIYAGLKVSYKMENLIKVRAQQAEYAVSQIAAY